ncbi:MAG: sporulation protein [Ruminococcus sp.]|nr:sporulation protein [Ruminococcus sp.]
MRKLKAVKRAAAAVSGMLVFAGTLSMSGLQIAVGETDESVAETTAAVGTAEEETSAAVQETTGAEEAAEPAPEWWKAEISEYDSSLSLISYELNDPAADSAVGGEENSLDDLSEEERIMAATAVMKTIRKSLPDMMKDDIFQNVEPTPVELYITGGWVGDVPPTRELPETNAESGDFTFVTYGWGHGVGMSQNGANLYATYSGWTYQDILFHYYPGTYLMNTEIAEDEELTIAGVPGDVLTVVSEIVYREVGDGMAYEAIKAQAVAVYTYIKYHGGDSHDLRGKADPPQRVIDACQEVLGEALFYEGDYCLTMFSASCGGCSADCRDVFWTDIPYLTSVQSDWDGAYDPHYGTVTYISADIVKSRIEAAYGIELSEDPNNWIKPEYSDSTGYVTYVNIDDQKTVKGYAFSLALGLKSGKFNLEYTE